ncbi:DUF3857 domain-containing protein [Algibacter sp. AS12]|uniref:hypothetical protein n=1 Tax=Algibacter sp. AS12 TaxID=3135773 RepID=UPI00398ACF18
MSKFTLLFILLISFTCLAQENYNSESYNVTLGDITSNTFLKDSTANAIVIFEHGNSYVDKNDFDLRTEKKHKTKILNRQGFNHANIVIHQYKNGNSKEYIEDIFATTYNLVNNKVIKTQLQEKDIFIEEFNENHTIIKFTLPNIKEGSIITYSYKIRSPFMFKYHGWNFQSEIPKLYSEYNTSIPGNWLYNIKLVGGKKLVLNDSKIEKNCLKMFNGASADCGVSKYAMKDIPAFIEENYMTTRANYLARIEYELQTFRGMDGTIKHYTKTWDAVDKELRTDKEIGKQLKKNIDAENILPNHIYNEPDILKKAKLIYKYVQHNYTWDEEYKIFSNTSIKDILKNKSGNVSSINILLHNLLKACNVNVNPVILSTRNNGYPTDLFPVLSEFNYQIVQASINENVYLLDATDKYLNFGEIPFRCLNNKGRLIDFKNGSSWITLKPSITSNIFYQANLKFNEDDQLVGTIKSKRTGYHALHKKKAYYSNSSDYLDKLENNFPYLEISNFKITSDIETSKDFKETYNLEYNFNEAGDNIYLNPFFVTFFKENPFKLQERTYPIDFGYSDSYFYMFNIELNDHYSIVEIPKEQKIALPNNTGQLVFSPKQVGNSINFLFKIDFKTPIYDVDYYPYLKAFMSKIVDIQNNTLILLKKTI